MPYWLAMKSIVLIADDRARLQGREGRFLRKEMDLRRAVWRVDRQSVVCREQGECKMPGPAGVEKRHGKRGRVAIDVPAALEHRRS